MKSLSKREKKLLYVMVYFVILGIGFLLIKPLIQNYGVLKEQKDSLEMEQQVVMSEVDMQSQLGTTLTQHKSYYEQHKNDIQTVIPNDQVEQNVMALLEKCGFKPISSSLTQQPLTSYKASSKASTTSTGAITSATSDYTEDGESSDMADTSTDGVDKIVVAIDLVSCEGNNENMKSLIDACASDSKFFINAYSAGDSTASNIFTDGGSTAYSIEIGFYMTEPLVDEN